MHIFVRQWQALLDIINDTAPEREQDKRQL